MFLSFLVFANTSLFAVSNSCKGTLVPDVHNATSDENYTDKVKSKGKNKSGFYRFRPKVDGSITINFKNTNGKKQAMRIGTNCSKNNIYGSGDKNSASKTFNVVANTWYYVQMQERNNQNRLRYTIKFDFTTTNEITNVSAPSVVTLGETITVTVEYSVSQEREIVTGFQQNHSPWDGWGWASVNVSAGTGTVNLSVTIPNNLTLGNNYQIPIVLQPLGGNWDNRLDNKSVDPVNVIAAAINHAPSAISQNITTTMDIPVNITLSGSDPDGDPIYYAIVTGPVNGTLSGSEPTLTYTPNNAYVGNDSFVYQVCEDTHLAGALCTSATVSITVTNNNNNGKTPPTMDDIPDQSAETNIPFNLNIANYVTEADGDTLTYSLACHPIPSGLSFNSNNGKLHFLPQTEGTIVCTATVKDSEGEASDNFTITTTAGSGKTNFTCANPKEFDIIYTKNDSGDIKLIGNTNICKHNSNGQCEDPLEATNNSIAAQYKDGDNNGDTKNSSSALLDIPDSAEILWAGMYWQGYFDANQLSPKKLTPALQEKSHTIKIGYTISKGKQTVNYTPLHSDELNWVYFSDTRWYYQGFKDVTSFVKSNGKGWYWGADINLQVGSIVAGGSLGAWSIAVAYKDSNETMKNLTIYHGYQALSNGDDRYTSATYATNHGCDSTPTGTGVSTDTTFVLSGFKTPTSGDIKSNLIFFGGEGDIGLTGDGISITDKNNIPHTISNTVNPSTNAINSSISVYGAHTDDDFLYPRYGDNTIGIDIDTYDIGSTGANIIGYDQNTTTVRMYTTTDGYFPGGFGMSTELYVPEVCYDYTVQRNGFDITTDDRSIIANEGNLSITVALQNKEGDFDFINSQIGIRLVPTANTSFTKALYAPNNVNTFIPAIHTPGSTTLKPIIGIGEDIHVNAGLTNGGIIKAKQRYFTQFNYNINQPYTGRFEVDLNTTLNFGAEDIPVTLSTQDNNIPRCPASNYYEPIEGSFNVERTGSSGAPNIKFPLYTQVVGKPFDFDVVAYNQSSNPPYSTELPLSGYTVDIELINADTFADKNSIFLCNNPHQNIIRSINATGRKNVFARFETIAGNSRVHLTNIQTDTAMKRAAFRIWYIIDKNNTIIPHNCPDPIDNPGASNSCFQTLYDTYLEQDDNITHTDGTIGFCKPKQGLSNCSAYINPIKGTSGCYACLRDYFSIPICSRDDFAVRPVSYRISVSDTDQSENANDTTTLLGENKQSTSVATLAAGYKYKLSGIATSAVNDTTRALSYITDFINNGTNDMSSLNFNGPTACTDKNNTNIDVHFEDGILSVIGKTNDLFSHSQVGNYAYYLHDNDWTLVDQQRFTYKTFPGVDDCIPNSSGFGNAQIKVGCTIDTNLTVNNIVNNYKNLYLTYMPYQFGLANIDMAIPNVSYTNNINTTDAQILSMAVHFDGNIIAEDISGTTLVNFSNGCAAQDVVFDINRTITIAGDENITGALPAGYTYQSQSIDGSGNSVQFSTNHIKTDINVTSAQFSEGNASVNFYFNFDRNITNPTNPAQVLYVSKEANSTASNSKAHLVTHTPKGSGGDINETVNFLFGKVKASKDFYPNIRANRVNTNIMVWVYCEHSQKVLGNCYGIDTSADVTDDIDWWLSSSHSELLKDGDIGLKVNSNTYAATVTQDVNINTNAIDKTIVIRNTSGTTPNTVRIGVETAGAGAKTDPWLIPSDMHGTEFIGNSNWTGHGKTGHVVDSNASRIINRRLGW